MNHTKIEKCPLCGESTGFYVYERIHHHLCFTFDGEPDGASEDEAEYSGSRIRCRECRRIIPGIKLSDIVG